MFWHDVLHHRRPIRFMDRDGIAGLHGFGVLATHSSPEIIFRTHIGALQPYDSSHWLLHKVSVPMRLPFGN